MYKKRLARIIISVCVFLIGAILSVAQPIKDIPLHIFLYIAAYFIVGASDIISAIKGIKQASFLGEKFLVTAVSIFALYKGEYVCAVAIMVLFSLGELFLELREQEATHTPFTKIYPPATVVVMLAVAIIPVFLGGDVAVWFHRALVVFLIICPLTLSLLKIIKK